MIRSDIIRMAQKLIMQGDIDPLWTPTEWSIFFDEAVDIIHEALVDNDSGYFQIRDFVIYPDDNGHYPLPDDFYAMIYVRDRKSKLEFLTKEEEHNYRTTGYIFVDDHIEIRNADGNLTPLTIDYYRNPKTMPEWEGSSDEANTMSIEISDFIPDPPLNTDRGAKVLARIIQYLAQSKDGTLSEAVLGHINSLVDRFVDRLYQRQKQ